MLIITLLAVSAAALLFLNFCVFSSEAETAVIEVDGKEYARYHLNGIAHAREIEIATEFGTNRILLQPKQVSVIASSCKDQLEVKAGLIDKAGQQLVCLPNRLVVRLEGGQKKIDGVTY